MITQITKKCPRSRHISNHAFHEMICRIGHCITKAVVVRIQALQSCIHLRRTSEVLNTIWIHIVVAKTKLCEAIVCSDNVGTNRQTGTGQGRDWDMGPGRDWDMGPGRDRDGICDRDRDVGRDRDMGPKTQKLYV